MELNHLRYFYFVAKTGGFSKASRLLRVAQPSITKTIKTLEFQIGHELFERTGKQISLTKIGNDIYRHCESIFDHIEEIDVLCKPEQTKVQGPLNITASEVIASHLVPLALKEFLRNHPDVYPQVTTTTATESLKLVLEKKAEFALLFHSPDLPEKLEIRNQFPVVFKVVIASHLAKSVETCSSFIGSREVDNVSSNRYPTLNKLQKIYKDAKIKISTNSLSAHLQMVLDGLGVSVLPEFMVREFVKLKRLSTLMPEEQFVFNLKLICLKEVKLSSKANSFTKYLTKTIEDL